MKRTTLISASLLLAFAGCTCGQGWRPNILTRFNNRIHGVSNVGEPCDAGCQGAAMAVPHATGNCDSCGNTGVNYGGVSEYDGVTVGTTYSGSTYGNTAYVGPINGSSVPTEYRPVATSYVPTTSRMEPITDKRAN